MRINISLTARRIPYRLWLISLWETPFSPRKRSAFYTVILDRALRLPSCHTTSSETVSLSLPLDIANRESAQSTYRSTVIAVAVHHVEHWVASNEEDVKHKLLTVHLSLECTRWVLLDNLGLFWEQEQWIRDEVRNLLSSLTEKMAAVTAEKLQSAFGWYIVRELATICRAVPRGHEMVPEGLLAIQQVWTPRDPSRREGWGRLYMHFNFSDLQSALRRQRRHGEQHPVRRSLTLTDAFFTEVLIPSETLHSRSTPSTHGILMPQSNLS